MQRQVFGMFQLVISIFSAGLLNKAGDYTSLSIPRLKAINNSSLNCSDHKLTQPLINLPMALTLWLVSRIQLCRILSDSDLSDVLLQYLRSISAVMDPLDHGLLMLTPASQNTWNAPFATWNLRNDLQDICPKLKIPAKCVVSIQHVCFFLSSKSNAHALSFATGTSTMAILVPRPSVVGTRLLCNNNNLKLHYTRSACWFTMVTLR